MFFFFKQKTAYEMRISDWSSDVCSSDLQLSIPEIVARGFDEATVKRVAMLVRRSEFKRRQAPPGPKVTSRAFGRERRYPLTARSEEHTSELQSLMRISYAVFCLKKKKKTTNANKRQTARITHNEKEY